MNSEPLPDQDDAGLQSILRFTEYDPTHKLNIAVQGSRFFAFAIDYMVWLIIFKIYHVIFALVLGAIARLIGDPIVNAVLSFISIMGSSLLSAIMYFGVLEILPIQGSLGKYLMGMTVSRDDDKPLMFGNVMIRATVRSVFWAIPLLVLPVPFIFHVVFPIGIWIDCLPGLITGPKHKAIHDMAAGTVVTIRPKKDADEPL